MKRKSCFLSILAPEKRLLTWVLSLIVLFLLPYPILGQTVGTLTIMENTRLREDHEGKVIIGADDVTLDCRGFTVSGTGFSGILLSGRTGITVKNCIVTGFFVGFLLEPASSNILTRNTANGNRDGFGIFGNSDGNHFIRNTANDSNRDGFTVTGFRNTLIRNTANDNNGFGFRIFASIRSTLTENIANDNGDNGFNVRGTMNTFTENEGCDNTGFDALDESTGGAGNTWVNNNFCTSSGF